MSKNPLSGFAPKQTIESSALAAYPHSAITPPHNECPVYDYKQFDGEVPVMLELWGMRNNPLLSLLPGPLWPGMVAPDRSLSMG